MGLSGSSIAMLVFASVLLYGGILYFILVVKNIHLIDYIPFSRDRWENFLEANFKIKGIFAVSLVVLILLPVWGASVDIEEKKGGGAHKYSIEFEEKSELVETIEGYTNEGDTSNEEISINHTNITKILFVLTWQESGDEALQDDEFRLTIIPPENINSNLTDANFTPSSSESGTSGEISIEVSLNQTKNVTKIRADTPKEVILKYTSLFGIGVWGVDIEAIDCPPDALIPFQPDDEGNDWTLEVTVYYYVGKVEEIKDVVL